MNEKYIFKCKLADQPVCVVWDHANGFYSQLLEECHVWHMVEDGTERGEFKWIADYPMIIKNGDSRFELEVNDTFTLTMP